MSFLPETDRATLFARRIILLGVFLTPLVLAPWTTNLLEINKQAILALTAGLALVAWFLGVVLSGQVKLRFSWVSWGVGAVAGAALVAAILGTGFGRGILGLPNAASGALVTVLALAVLYFVAAQVFSDRGRTLRNVLAGSVSIALIFGFLQLIARYVFPFALAHSRVFNTVGSPNALGVLAAIVLPILIVTRLAPRWARWLDLAKISFAAALAILILLNWWPLWAIAGAGMVALIAVRSVQSQTGTIVSRSLIRRFLAPLGVIVIGVVMLVTGFSSSVRGELPIEITPSFKLSLKVAGQAIRERPLVGYGPEQFSIAFDRYGANHLANTVLSDAVFYDGASEILTLAAEQGILGLLAIGALLGFSVLAAVRLTANPGLESGGAAVLAALCAAWASLFLYPGNLVILGVFFVLTALLVLASGDETSRTLSVSERPAVSLASSLGFVAGLMLVIVAWYGLGTRYLGDVAFARALKESSPQDAVAQLTAALNRDANNDQFHRALSQAVIQLLRQELGKKPDPADPGRAERIQNNFTAAVGLAQRAVELGPRDAANWLNLGTVYQSLIGLVDGADEFARQALARAGEFRPGDPGIPNRIGMMYLGVSELAGQLARSGGANAAQFRQNSAVALVKAEESFKRALDLAPNFGLAIYNLGSVYERQGKLVESIRQIERIIPANANNPNLLFELGLLYYRAGRKDDAVAALRRAVALAPQYANVRWYLGLIFEERRDLPAAIEQVEKILETNQDNQVVIDKLAALRAGQTEFPPGRVIDKKPL